MIIQSLVLNISNYCNVIWGTTNTTILKDDKKLQNFAAKVVDDRKYDQVASILKELELLNIKDIIIIDTRVTMFKYLINSYPDHFLTFPTVWGHC